MEAYEPKNDALLWGLREVADAATEIPADAQTPRLRDALARLVVAPTTQAEEDDA